MCKNYNIKGYNNIIYNYIYIYSDMFNNIANILFSLILYRKSNIFCIIIKYIKKSVL